mmetsp:Transcript_537/g.1593  ORF Transcript_537/g.1593 Transcript_537/m.1593 type:complete len:225 (+) Transcript_537:352-1026(+)
MCDRPSRTGNAHTMMVSSGDAHPRRRLSAASSAIATSSAGAARSAVANKRPPSVGEIVRGELTHPRRRRFGRYRVEQLVGQLASPGRMFVVRGSFPWLDSLARRPPAAASMWAHKGPVDRPGVTKSCPSTLCARWLPGASPGASLAVVPAIVHVVSAGQWRAEIHAHLDTLPEKSTPAVVRAKHGRVAHNDEQSLQAWRDRSVCERGVPRYGCPQQEQRLARKG